MDQICSRVTSKLLVALLVIGVTVGAVCAQTPKPAAPSPAPATSAQASPSVASLVPADKVVLKVGDRQFTKADIDMLIANLTPQMQRAIATEGKKSLGDQYALVVALSHQAEVQHLDQSPEFVQKLAFQKEQLEAQTAFENLNSQAKVTPEDIQQYYTAHAEEYDQITVRQVIVRKKAADAKTDPAHPAAPSGTGLSPEEAKIRAEAIRKALVAGTDIKKVSEDFKSPGDVIIDAEPRTVRHGGMRPDMEKVAFALKDGEVSEPIDVPQALVAFQVIKHSHSDLKDVSPEIEKKLRQEKVEASIDGVKKSANIWMDDEYFASPKKPEVGPTMGPPPATTQPKQ
jgi:parvulin-like peptidyl-prolyl isomerase